MSEFRKMSPVFEEGATPPPKKRPGSAPILLLLLAGFGLCLLLIAAGLGILMPVVNKGRSGSARALCLRNVSRLAQANLMYAADHDDRLPLGENWAQLAPAYLGVRGEFLLRCPEARRQGRGRYGIAYNAALASKVVAALKNPEKKPLIFDSNAPGRAPAAGVGSLPAPGRHLAERRGNNFAFADGSSRFVEDGKSR